LFARVSGRTSFIGVVHLLPLPGAPRPSPGLTAVIARAVADARALADGGVDAMILENLGDAPFVPGSVDPWTVATMTRAALAVRAAAPRPLLGINVLRNDALAALSIAAACDAAFIRVNVLTGAMLGDQGVLTGRARELWLERTRIGAGHIRIAADVLVKHAVPLAPIAAEDAARDLVERAGADVVIVSGKGTGRETDPDRVRGVRAAIERPVWVGSGWQPDRPCPDADGAIVGTWLHAGGDLSAPIDPARVAAARAVLNA
jgi:membrane complex biogenesis BtpA family protein